MRNGADPLKVLKVLVGKKTLASDKTGAAPEVTLRAVPNQQQSEETNEETH
jgi:hypothetical protein